jgi:hypothetical protein
MMTRDECLGAISAAFGGVKVEAVVGYWNVRIYSVPARELILESSFVAQHVHGDGMTPGELSEYIKIIPDSRWAKHDDGVLMLGLR